MTTLMGHLGSMKDTASALSIHNTYKSPVGKNNLLFSVSYDSHTYLSVSSHSKACEVAGLHLVKAPAFTCNPIHSTDLC